MEKPPLKGGFVSNFSYLVCAECSDALRRQRSAGDRACDIVAVNDLRVFPVQNGRVTRYKTAHFCHRPAIAAFATLSHDQRLCFSEGNNGFKTAGADPERRKVADNCIRAALAEGLVRTI